MRLEDEHFTKHQLIAYAVIALETIQRSANKITPLEIAKEIPIIIKLHTPVEAVKRANRILKNIN